MVARRLVAAGLALAVGVLAPAGPGVAADEPIPASVEALHAAVNAEDVDAAAGTFADDAVVIVPRVGGLPQIYVGREQLRWWLSGLAAQHARFARTGGPRPDGSHVRWSDAFSVDAFRQLGVSWVEVDSDAVLATDRRIAALTIVLTPEAARILQAAPDTPSAQPQGDGALAPAAVALGAVLACLGCCLGRASARLLRRPIHADRRSASVFALMPASASRVIGRRRPHTSLPGGRLAGSGERPVVVKRRQT